MFAPENEAEHEDEFHVNTTRMCAGKSGETVSSSCVLKNAFVHAENSRSACLMCTFAIMKTQPCVNCVLSFGAVVVYACVFLGETRTALHFLFILHDASPCHVHRFGSTGLLAQKRPVSSNPNEDRHGHVSDPLLGSDGSDVDDVDPPFCNVAESTLPTNGGFEVSFESVKHDRFQSERGSAPVASLWSAWDTRAPQPATCLTRIRVMELQLFFFANQGGGSSGPWS